MDAIQKTPGSPGKVIHLTPEEIKEATSEYQKLTRQCLMTVSLDEWRKKVLAFKRHRHYSPRWIITREFKVWDDGEAIIDHSGAIRSSNIASLEGLDASGWLRFRLVGPKHNKPLFEGRADRPTDTPREYLQFLEPDTPMEIDYYDTAGESWVRLPQIDIGEILNG